MLNLKFGYKEEYFMKSQFITRAVRGAILIYPALQDIVVAVHRLIEICAFSNEPPCYFY